MSHCWVKSVADWHESLWQPGLPAKHAVWAQVVWALRDVVSGLTLLKFGNGWPISCQLSIVNLNKCLLRSNISYMVGKVIQSFNSMTFTWLTWFMLELSAWRGSSQNARFMTWQFYYNHYIITSKTLSTLSPVRLRPLDQLHCDHLKESVAKLVTIDPNVTSKTGDYWLDGVLTSRVACTDPFLRPSLGLVVPLASSGSWSPGRMVGVGFQADATTGVASRHNDGWMTV